MRELLNRLSKGLDRTLNKIEEVLDFENPLPGRNIYKILQHKEDSRLIDETVDYLRDNRNIENKTVILSCGLELTLEIV